MLYKTALLFLTALGCAAACDDVNKLQTALRTNRNGVGDSLLACVAPLLVAPMQWLPAGQATEFCRLEACKRVVNELYLLSPCTWAAEVPAGNDANALAMAQQVMRDCTST